MNINIHVCMFVCLFNVCLFNCMIVCLEEGRYQVLVWWVVICYASDVIEYDRRTPELFV